MKGLKKRVLAIISLICIIGTTVCGSYGEDILLTDGEIETGYEELLDDSATIAENLNIENIPDTNATDTCSNQVEISNDSADSENMDNSTEGICLVSPDGEEAQNQLLLNEETSGLIQEHTEDNYLYDATEEISDQEELVVGEEVTEETGAIYTSGKMQVSGGWIWWLLSGNTLYVSGSGDSGITTRSATVNKDVITNVYFSSDVKTLPYGFLNSCNNIRSIAIPSNVTSLGAQCFSNCTGLTSVSLSSNLTEIPSSCFSGCYNLTSIDIPRGVLVMNNNCFKDCSRLAEVNIPDTVVTMWGGCFANCTSLAEITIPDSVRTINSTNGGGSFSGCSTLERVKLSNNIISLDSSCFENCTNLREIVLPDCITSIGAMCFKNCSSLRSIVK